MKTIYSFILCTYFCIAAAFAQQYVPFPTENAIWRISTSAWEVGYSIYSLRTIGDTVISRQVYTKLWNEGLYCTQEPGINYFCGQGSSYGGAFREDNKRIYMVPPGESQERLLYDFNNLQIGDTINHWWTYDENYESNVISRIDSIQLYDGSMRKQYCLGDTSYMSPTCFIEGIGSTAGFFSHMNQSLEYSSTLDCFRVGFEHLWSYDAIGYTTCGRYRLDAEEAPENSFAINMYPNPANDILHIASDVDLSAQATIYNTLGQTQTQAELFGNQHSIDISGLADGIYYLHLQTPKGEKVSYKFVKAQP
jgi:hypothetical protein